MVIVPIYRVTKTAMTVKVEKKLIQVAGKSEVEESRLSLDKGNMTSCNKKTLQNTSKKEVDHILRKMIVKIISQACSNKLSTVTRELRNPTLVSYAVTLQRETKHRPIIQNMATPRHIKQSCVVLYNSNKVLPKTRENKR